jgi:hypothetical protein
MTTTVRPRGETAALPAPGSSLAGDLTEEGTQTPSLPRRLHPGLARNPADSWV